jgi:hypothetical protein
MRTPLGVALAAIVITAWLVTGMPLPAAVQPIADVLMPIVGP